MPRTKTMATIRTACKRRADQENSSLVADAEWNALISEKYGELYEAVAEASRYFESSLTITATGATSYDEPTDWLQTLRVERVDGSGRRNLIPLMPDERDRFVGQTGDATRYERIDDQIYLYPNPSSGSYRMLYKPQAPDLSAFADADLVDCVNAGGESMLVWGVAAIALAKAESNPALALAQEEKALVRAVEQVVRESATEAPRRGQPDFTHLEDGPYDDWRYR